MKRLSKKQEKLANLLNQKGLSLSKASVVLKTDLRNVRRMAARIQKFKAEKGGAISSKIALVGSPHGTRAIFKVRLHNIQFHIRPSFLMERYHFRRMKGSSFRVGNNSLVLGEKSFEVYSSDSFWGANADDCLRKAMDYFWTFFEELEDLLGVVFVKDKSSGVSMVRSHYAEVGNELAQDVRERKESLQFRGADDKTWLLADSSLGVPELEAVHSESSRADLNAIKPFFDDLRAENPGLTFSRILSLLKAQQEANRQTALGLQGAVEALRVLLPVKGPEVLQETGGRSVPDYVG